MKKTFDLKKKNILNSTLIIGLPGIGNVGKIVTDYMIEQTCAKIIGKFYIDTPPMVFTTKKGIEFPSVKVYHSNFRGKNYLFVAGDYQPRESKCFEFCSKIIDMFLDSKGKEILILGGASLPNLNSDPSVYAITSKNLLMQKYKKIEPKLKNAHGNLGPIVGVAGVLLGLAKDRRISATAFLTETPDQGYFHIKSVKKALSLFNKLTGITIDHKKFDAKVKNMDAEISSIQEAMDEDYQNLPDFEPNNDPINYIG